MSGMNETPKGNRTHIAAVGCEVSRVGRPTAQFTIASKWQLPVQPIL